MKYIFILLALITSTTVEAQKKEITISAQGKSVSTLFDSEDASIVLTINSALPTAKTGKLKIVNNKWQSEKDWKRSFSIYNSEVAGIADLKPCKTGGVYELSLKTLLAKVTKGESYRLYTMAIPRDPKKAALVRVRRVLVCTITIN
jgi:hypothetical protein